MNSRKSVPAHLVQKKLLSSGGNSRCCQQRKHGGSYPSAHVSVDIDSTELCLSFSFSLSCAYVCMHVASGWLSPCTLRPFLHTSAPPPFFPLPSPRGRYLPRGANKRIARRGCAIRPLSLFSDGSTRNFASLECRRPCSKSQGIVGCSDESGRFGVYREYVWDLPGVHAWIRIGT